MISWLYKLYHVIVVLSIQNRGIIYIKSGVVFVQNKIKQLRLEAGISQRATAELLGYHTTTYQRWENDIHNGLFSRINKR